MTTTATASAPTPAALPRSPGLPKRVGWVVMAVLAVLLFLLASRYLLVGEGAYFPPQREVYRVHTAGILAHIAGAMVATLLGPIQFLPQSRTPRYLRLHRWLGRAYLGGVLVGGLAGLYMSFLAFGGFPARLGFGLLAVAWLVSGGLAYRHIRRKEIQPHRQWMIRNYALTFAAVTLRLWLVAFQFAGVAFLEAYITVAWLCWVPNLVVAELLVARIRPGRLRAAPA